MLVKLLSTLILALYATALDECLSKYVGDVDVVMPDPDLYNIVLDLHFSIFPQEVVK